MNKKKRGANNIQIIVLRRPIPPRLNGSFTIPISRINEHVVGMLEYLVLYADNKVLYMVSHLKQ